MKIAFHCDTLEKLGQKAAGAAEVVGAAAGQIRSGLEEHVQRVRLERAVRDVEEEIDIQMRAIGELIYATHLGAPSDSDDIREILEYVDSLREELSAHLQQLELLAGILVCPGCGARNGSGNAYCGSCGQPLDRD